MLVIALLVSEGDVAVMMAALAGACIGFLPYNLNPAKIFMGDTGATFLGYMLATVSVQGMFKLYAIISFVVPFLMLGLPIFDTTFAIIRRLSHGQNPMSPDRSHIHHRLIDMGFNQKQAVAYPLCGVRHSGPVRRGAHRQQRPQGHDLPCGHGAGRTCGGPDLPERERREKAAGKSGAEAGKPAGAGRKRSGPGDAGEQGGRGAWIRSRS